MASKPLSEGPASASARAKGQAERARQQQRHQEALRQHPVLERVRNFVAPAPDAGRSWETGAIGEERLGAILASLQPGVLVLNDRKRPRSTANIDHLAITASGVWVIDAKRYSGRIAAVDRGGWSKSDWHLTVAGRDRMRLVAGVHGQVADVEAALTSLANPPPVSGALCFVDGDWGWFAKPFTIDGVLVAWPSALCAALGREGPFDADARVAIHDHLAHAFRPFAQH
jgi:hypothetical protein